MNATAEVCVEELTLEEEYKAALAVWSDARSQDRIAPNAAEVFEASKWVNDVERKLRNHRAAHGC